MISEELLKMCDDDITNIRLKKVGHKLSCPENFDKMNIVSDIQDPYLYM